MLIMHSAYDFLFQASLDICLEFGFPKKRYMFDVSNFVTRICTLIFLNIFIYYNSQLKNCLCFVELLGEMFNSWMKVLLLHIAFDLGMVCMCFWMSWNICVACILEKFTYFSLCAWWFFSLHAQICRKSWFSSTAVNIFLQ